MLTDGRTDDGRTTDTFIYYKLTYEPSGELKMDFSEAFEACDLKIGRYRQLIDCLKVYEY